MKTVKFFSDLANEAIVTPEMISFLENLPAEPGRYALADGAFANYDKYSVPRQEPPKWEAHEEYIDIQCIIQGFERIEWTPVDNLSVEEAYCDKRDIAFYSAPENLTPNSGILSVGKYIIFHPEDAHKPCLPAADGSSDILKVVFKVPVSVLKK